MAEAFWQVNGSEVKNFGETRIQVMQERMQRYFPMAVKAAPTFPPGLQLHSKHWK